MKHWEKVLMRASKVDKDRLEKVVLMLEEKSFPPDTVKLSDKDVYRVRVGKWRIQFHYYGKFLIIDDIGRRNENTYR